MVFLTTRRVDQPASPIPGSAPSGPASPSSSTQNAIQVVRVTSASPPTDVIVTPLRVTNPVISPNGRSVAFQMMPRDDWELYVTDVDRKGDVRLTNEIQHDHTPRFLTDRQLLGVLGENRHRRSVRVRRCEWTAHATLSQQPAADGGDGALVGGQS